MTYVAQARRRDKPVIAKELVGWPRGYVSAGIVEEDALADLYNLDLNQDSLPTDRPSLVPYGVAFLGICIGMGTYHKMVNGKPERYEISMQAINTNEVQTLVISGAPTGGTFTLTYSGQTTSSIAYNASAASVQAALVALSNIGNSDVVCSGGSLPGTKVLINFAGALANTNVPLITTSGAGLTGGTSPAVAVKETSPGGLQGVVHVRKDGGAWSAPDNSARYDATAEWADFTHSNNRVYIDNNSNNLSYLDIVAGVIVRYTEIDKPAAPSLAQTGLGTSPSFPYFCATTFYNEAGETDQSVAANILVQVPRESWDPASQYVDINAGTLPDGADGTNFYVGTSLVDIRLVATVPGAATFRDDGRSLAAITKRPPFTNSTGGPICGYGINILGQVFLWGGPDNLVWYDGGGSGPGGSGNFTIAGGGGYIGIDDGGPSVPMAVLSFRDGKGNPCPTIVCSGAAGTGGVRHLTFTPQTIGDLTALEPSLSEANGNDGTVSPLATVLANNSIHFPTGTGFKFYGSAPNIPNILSPDSSSDFILPDVRKLNLDAMRGARALEFEGRVYFALPVITEQNNQIWVLDLNSNPSKWIMPWDIAAKHMWLYEDNSGTTHFCILKDNKVLQFDRNVRTEDDGVPFRTHAASGPLKWSKSGFPMGYIQDHSFMFESTRGSFLCAVSGEGLDGPIDEFTESETVTPTPDTGWGQMVWGEDEFGGDPENIDSVASKIDPVVVDIKQTMSRLTWEITTDKPNCGYTLTSTFSNGKIIPKLYARR